MMPTFAAYPVEKVSARSAPKSLGQRRLEALMLRVVPGDEPRRGRAHSLLREHSRSSVSDAWIGGEAEVVVGAEVDGGSEFGVDDGAATVPDRAKDPFAVAVPEVRQLGGENVVEGGRVVDGGGWSRLRLTRPGAAG